MSTKRVQVLKGRGRLSAGGGGLTQGGPNAEPQLTFAPKSDQNNSSCFRLVKWIRLAPAMLPFFLPLSIIFLFFNYIL